MIAIIDYNAGNLKSVEKALHFLGEDCVITRNFHEIETADKVILPGVGAFGDAMEQLKKYELDKKTGLLRLDRILYTSTHYPANYGFIPRTYADDGDPLDVLVFCSETLDPMVEVDCYPIGTMRMIDGDAIDDKIIAVPFQDPTWNFYKDISEIPPHCASEISHFFEIYKALEHKHTATSDALGSEQAQEVIRRCIEQYEIHFCGKVEPVLEP